MRNIELSRGSREGNNALIKDVGKWRNDAASQDSVREAASEALAQSDATWEECKKFATIIGKLQHLGMTMSA